jgi:hypothetical protein
LGVAIGSARADSTTDETTTVRTRIAISAVTGSALEPAQASELIAALEPSNQPSVRRAAAFALRNALQARLRTGTHMRRQIVAALMRSAETDPSASVRRIARESLEFAQEVATSMTMNQHATGFVTVAEVFDSTRVAPLNTSSEMALVLRQALKQHAPSMQIASHNKMALPSAQDLAQARLSGFYVAGTISKMRVAQQGGSLMVECAVSLSVSPWEGRDAGNLRAEAGASASGTGRVDGARPHNVEQAKSECMRSVITQVAAQQVAPFLRQAASRR